MLRLFSLFILLCVVSCKQSIQQPFVFDHPIAEDSVQVIKDGKFQSKIWSSSLYYSSSAFDEGLVSLNEVLTEFEPIDFAGRKQWILNRIPAFTVQNPTPFLSYLQEASVVYKIVDNKIGFDLILHLGIANSEAISEELTERPESEQIREKIMEFLNLAPNANQRLTLSLQPTFSNLETHVSIAMIYSFENTDNGLICKETKREIPTSVKDFSALNKGENCRFKLELNDSSFYKILRGIE